MFVVLLFLFLIPADGTAQASEEAELARFVGVLESKEHLDSRGRGLILNADSEFIAKHYELGEILSRYSSAVTTVKLSDENQFEVRTVGVDSSGRRRYTGFANREKLKAELLSAGAKDADSFADAINVMKKMSPEARRTLAYSNAFVKAMLFHAFFEYVFRTPGKGDQKRYLELYYDAAVSRLKEAHHWKIPRFGARAFLRSKIEREIELATGERFSYCEFALL